MTSTNNKIRNDRDQTRQQIQLDPGHVGEGQRQSALGVRMDAP